MDNFEGKWFIAYTKTNAENAAKNSLDVEVFIPMVEAKTATTKEQVRVVLRPKFKNYIYIKHDGSANFFDRVCLNPNIVSFVSKEPVAAPEMQTVVNASSKKHIQNGESVKIINGPFEDMIGTVKDVVGDCYVIEFPIFGQKVTEEVPRDCLINC